MNIAVLEDNPSIVGYMTTALQMAGHHVAVHTHGASLLEALFPEEGVRKPLPYDLITVDLLLPGGLSGIEVIARIRRAFSRQVLPIIVISGATQSFMEPVTHAFPDGTLLAKPFKLQKLLRLLESQIPAG